MAACWPSPQLGKKTKQTLNPSPEFPVLFCFVFLLWRMMLGGADLWSVGVLHLVVPPPDRLTFAGVGEKLRYSSLAHTLFTKTSNVCLLQVLF